MKQHIGQILDLLMAAVGGVYLGYVVFQVIDYRSYPALYAMQSAPWFLGILLYGALAVALVAVLFGVKWFLRKKQEEEE